MNGSAACGITRAIGRRIKRDRCLLRYGTYVYRTKPCIRRRAIESGTVVRRCSSLEVALLCLAAHLYVCFGGASSYTPVHARTCLEASVLFSGLFFGQHNDDGDNNDVAGVGAKTIVDFLSGSNFVIMKLNDFD